ncbi:MAG: hypothetical protein CALGDGBN_00712 [Pseudomonadales bacterium]|nr:hypothetical protein [Pseudomonadales bacterium]
MPTEGLRRAAPWWLLVAILAPLLFLGGPDFHSPRSFRLAWQLGHPLLFFGMVAAVTAIPRLRGIPFLRLFALATALALVLGGAIELAQGLWGRERSLSDLRLDVIGAWAGAVWAGRGGSRTRQTLRAAVGWGSLLLLAAVDVRPLAVALVDEHQARRSFPLLSGFHTDLEVQRWRADGRMTLVPPPDGEGGGALRVSLAPAVYSGFRMQYFPRDWRGYHALRLRVFTEENQKLACRIHDVWHDQRHADRFNRSLVLVPGWNLVEIALAEVEAAPAGRTMDMSRIAEFGCFIVRPARPVVLQIAAVELVRNSA